MDGIGHSSRTGGAVARLVVAWRGTSTLFVAGVAVIAVHVLDDSFLRPSQGVSASDHLVSGLTPLALLAVAVWAFPRLSGGGRGALALTLGALGLAAGGEATYDTITAVPTGDDYTGLLASCAGLVLLAAGAMMLWRSRRSDGSRTRRYLRRSLVGVAGLAVFANVVLPTGLAYLDTHAAGADVPTAHLGAGYEDVSFRTTDGLRLSGWYVPSRNGAAVITVPGRGGPQAHARMLVRHGYGVLLFDRRGQGASEGDPTGWGWGGSADVKAAIGYLQRRPDVDPDRIGGLGLSVGGEVLIQTAAETDALRAVASEGAGIRSLRETLDLPSASKWAVVPFKAVETAALSVFYNRPPPAALGELVAEVSPRPLLLMYAAGDHGGETDLNPVYHRAAGDSATLWKIPGAGHVGGITAQPEEYERRVVAFFDDALLTG